MLLDAFLAHSDAKIALSKALADLNRSIFMKTQGFLTSASAVDIYNGSSAAAGFVLKRIDALAASELSATYGIDSVSGPTVSSNRQLCLSHQAPTRQPTVLIFVVAAAREVLCVIETKGLVATVVPMPTVCAMLQYSADEAFRAANTAQITLVRNAMRDAVAGAAPAGVDDDYDEEVEDGEGVVDEADTQHSSWSGVISAEQRRACLFAAARLSPPSAPTTLGSLALLLHVLH